MVKKNNILFISTICSYKVFEYIQKTSSDKSGQAIQKFHNLLLSGLAMQESNIVETLTSIPITHNTNKKRFWHFKPEIINNIKFNYIITINFPFIKNIIVFIYSFFRIILWKTQRQANTSPIVICDALNVSIVSGAYLGCKLRKIKIIGIVTDVPGLNTFELTLIKKIAGKVARFLLAGYDGYILITEQMNRIVNSRMKPHMVMEGLVDVNMTTVENRPEMKDEKRIVLYSGGIYEHYGIKILIESFMKLDNKDIRLDIYGTGPMEKVMPKYMAQDKRIRYFGEVPNKIIIEKQLQATLLVNPRPSKAEYTKYSFPSKNMEYMVSGTPLATTSLPGMPDEYLPFVYLFEDESVNGIYSTLNDLLKKPTIELHGFGSMAKAFVLSHKNNFEQARRVTSFVEQVNQD